MTLKNFAIFTGVLLVAFVAISTYSEMRSFAPGDYGRLFGREVPPPVEPKPVEVVHEAPPPVDDTTHADPMLVEPMERAQWLVDDPTATTTMTTPVVVSSASARGDADVTIVGGTEGVTIVQRERRKPVLSGGFGR